MKKFNLRLTDEEHECLKNVAKAHNKSMTSILRIYLRIGLNGEKMDTSIILRQHRKDKHVFIA